MKKKLFGIPQFLLLLLPFFYFIGCNSEQKAKFRTQVSIQNGKWYFNNEIINKDSPAEGLLMNVRMVNSMFEDRGEAIPNEFDHFEPMQNTANFISVIPEYVQSGINAFTVSLQGGLPGYEGAVNSAFNSDGTLRDEYFKRVEKIIQTADANNAVIILSCFYQRQHSHFSALNGKESIKNALKNVVDWVTKKKFSNVILEVSNEYRHGGFRNWPDGDWLISAAGQVELIKLARQVNPNLLISTSGMGNGKMEDEIISAADFILIHFNNTSLNDYNNRISVLKKYKKPIVCNEDNKLGKMGAMALKFSVLNGSGWGYMNMPKNQYIPFEYDGTDDDPEVYSTFRNVTTPGYQINPNMVNQTFIMITNPNDGQVFNTGHNLRIHVSLVNPPDSMQYHVEIMANGEPVAITKRNLRANWLLLKTGTFVLKAVLKDNEGREIHISPPTDIIVQSDK